MEKHKGKILGTGVGLALAILPAAAHAALVVPKAEVQAPITTPRAAVPQAPSAPSPAPAAATPNPSVGGPSLAAAAAPEPGSSQQEPPVPNGAYPTTPQQNKQDIEDRIKWFKYQIEQANTTVGDFIIFAAALAELEKELADVNGKLAAAKKAEAYANAIQPEKLTEQIEPEMLLEEQIEPEMLTEDTQPENNRSLPPTIDQFADPFDLSDNGQSGASTDPFDGTTACVKGETPKGDGLLCVS